MLKRVLLAVAFIAAAAGLTAGPASAAGPAAWTAPTPTVVARANSAEAVLSDGRVAVAGGVGDGGALSSAEIYDVSHGTWSALPAMHEPRWFPLAAALAGNRLLVVGEADFANHPEGSATYEVFDGNTNSWSASKPFPSTSWGGRLLTLSTGKVLYVNNSDGTALYDPSSDTWTAISVPWASDLRTGSATRLSSNAVLVTTTNGFSSPSAYLFDPVTESWQQTSAPNVTVDYLQTALLADGQVLATVDKFNFGLNQYESRVLIFDPVASTWRTGPSPATQLHGARLVATPSGRALAVGGEEYTPQNGCTCGSVNAVAYTAEFDGATETWSARADLHVARGYPHTLTTTRGVIAFAGGPGIVPLSSEEFIENGVLPIASIGDARIAEGGKGVAQMEFTVRLSEPAAASFTITATTSDVTATAPTDYVGGAYAVNFEAGQDTATVRVPVRGDVSKEQDETFGVTLSGASASFADAYAVGTIANDDIGLCTILPGVLQLCVGVQIPVQLP